MEKSKKNQYKGIQPYYNEEELFATDLSAYKVIKHLPERTTDNEIFSLIQDRDSNQYVLRETHIKDLREFEKYIYSFLQYQN